MVFAIAALALKEAVWNGAATSTFRGFRVQAVCLGVAPGGDATWRHVRLAVRWGAAELEASFVVDGCDGRREPMPCAHGPLD
jgi:hypothetical protein